MKINDVLIKPVLTEKGTNLANQKEFLFETNIRANKHQIREALEKLFKVKVSRIRIMVRKGKSYKVGRKMVLKYKPDRKIAFVKLSEGKIDLFPQA